MQFPDVQFVPIERRRGDRANSFAAITTQFLDDFFRGDREETRRSGEASIMQALQLMNSPLVVTRINDSRMRGSLAAVLENPDDVLVQSLYLLVLSRPATPDELATAVELISNGDRQQNAEDLMWEFRVCSGLTTSPGGRHATIPGCKITSCIGASSESRLPGRWTRWT